MPYREIGRIGGIGSVKSGQTPPAPGLAIQNSAVPCHSGDLTVESAGRAIRRFRFPYMRAWLSYMSELTYRSAGVDLELYEQAMQKLPRLMQRTFTPGVMELPGGFAGSTRHGCL